MCRLTIFTPTYNRKECLPQLYMSLINQTNRNFIWLIVDDGSTDYTEELVRKWREENAIRIEYHYQENQGKSIAIKTAVAACWTPWFLCVDSDDTLSPNAVKLLLADANELLPSGGIGYIYPRCQLNRPVQRLFPREDLLVHIMDAKNLYSISETAILFQTEQLKRLEFPGFPGERFLSEEVLYIQLAQYGKFVTRNEIFYQSAYYNGGLTRNVFRLWVNNPKGTILLLTKRYKFCGGYPFGIRIRERMKSILNLNAFCMVRHISIFETTPSRCYSAILYAPAVVWRRIRFSGWGRQSRFICQG